MDRFARKTFNLVYEADLRDWVGMSICRRSDGGARLLMGFECTQEDLIVFGAERSKFSLNGT